jgi:vacuolar-type H+-ATPase subunit C/Vma6
MVLPEQIPYVNARLRARKSRLLGRGLLRELARSSSVEAVTKKLQDTPYASHLDRSRSLFKKHEDGAEYAVNAALAEDLDGVKNFSSARGTPVEPLFTRWDVSNLKAVFRGLHGHLPSGKILSSCTLAGWIEWAVWTELAAAPGLKEGVELAATLRLVPLSVLREGMGVYQRTRQVRALESALDRWFYAEARLPLQTRAGKSSFWRPVDLALEAEVDEGNLMRVVEALFRRKPPQLIEGGAWPWKKLLPKLAETATPFTLLSDEVGRRLASPDSGEIALNLADKLEGPTLGALERAGWRSRIKLLTGDPLSVELIIGYVWARVAEAIDLRRVIWGVHFGMDWEQTAHRMLSS